MDLREVIEKVKYSAESAHSSFHAGRREDAENHLFAVEKLVVEYLRMPASPAGDVTESAISEKPDEVPLASAPEVPGAPAQLDSPAAAAAAQNVGRAPCGERRTQ